MTPHTVIHVPEVVKVYDRTLHDAHNEPAQDMTVAQILEKSSNKGTVLVAKDRLGEASLFDVLSKDRIRLMDRIKAVLTPEQGDKLLNLAQQALEHSP